MKAVAQLISRHFAYLFTYVRIPIKNAGNENVNSKFQWVKCQTRGFRNEERFLRSIIFYLGGLNLGTTHTSS